MSKLSYSGQCGRIVITSILLASSPSVAQTASAVGTARTSVPGDAKLTCPQILAEVHFRNEELAILQDALNKVDVNPSAETQAIAVAAQGVALLSMALSVPPPIATAVGTLGSTAHLKSSSNDIKKAYAPIQTQFDFALDRMDYLHGLYQRRCVARGK